MEAQVSLFFQVKQEVDREPATTLASGSTSPLKPRKQKKPPNGGLAAGRK
jgi:hypothetical protein